MGLHLGEEMHDLLGMVPLSSSRIRSPERGLETLKDSSIIAVCADSEFGVLSVSVSNHRKETVRHLHAIDCPGSVELLVTAVLRVDLSKHEKLNIGRVTSERTIGAVCFGEIINLRFLQRQSHSLVSLLKNLLRRLITAAERNSFKWQRTMLGEHQVQIRLVLANKLRHPVMQDVLETQLVFSILRTKAGDLHSPLNAFDVLAEAADVGNAGGLGAPWRDGSGTWANVEDIEFTIGFAKGRRDIIDVTVAKELFEDLLLRGCQTLGGVDVMDPLGTNV
ncbi:hypothetical protein BJX64DRAFT_256802 [Aspergillus heterothallicus]